MSDTLRIKDFLLDKCGMDLAGVADAALLEDAPEGHRPSDILPGAKAVIVFGRAIADGSVQTVFRHFEDGHPTARGSYVAYGADLAPNFTLFFATFELSRHIERVFGFATAPLPLGPMQCGVPNSVPIPAFAAPFTVGLPLDIERAAFAAGLGDYGYSGRLLTKQFGARVQFGAAVTQMPLDFDSPYAGEPLCGGASCQACVRICPAKALPPAEEGDTRNVGAKGSEREVANVKLNRCIVAACGLRKEYGGEEDFCEAAPDDEALAVAFQKKPINNFEGLDHYPKWRCDKCRVYCRAGGWDAKFRQRGLTHDTDVR